jgi:imidazolonepropionase-like amidohydrolase
LTDRKQLAFIAADTGDEIAAALAIIKQYNLNARLVGARLGDESAEQIAARKIPVIYPPMLKVSKDKDLARPGKLAAAGVKIAFASNAPQSNPADIRTSAVIAAKYGMDRKAALRSITRNAAEILGVANRLGSIQKGKDADLVILSGDPLQLTSAVVVVIINGDIVYQREEK